MQKRQKKVCLKTLSRFSLARKTEGNSKFFFFFSFLIPTRQEEMCLQLLNLSSNILPNTIFDVDEIQYVQYMNYFDIYLSCKQVYLFCIGIITSV